jgi:nucleoside-diphosphate-sugar epimerase
MRVLVTGHSGFTGRYIIDALNAAGHEALPFNADVTDWPDVEAAVAEGKPDAAIHLAANAFVQSSDVTGFYLVNQIGTFHLLEAIVRHSPGIPVLVASSANVYGDSSQGLLSEDAICAPVNHYGASKLAMEIGAKLWANRLKLVIARPFNYTGEGQDERYLIAKIVAHFRRRDPAIELGNIGVAREFGDVRSVTQAYVELLERGCEGTFNICTGQVHSVADVIQICEQISGHSIAVQVNPAFVRHADPQSLGGDPSRIRSALPNWRPHDLRETLEWMMSSK